MKTEAEILAMLEATKDVLEPEMDIKIRNGQATQGIRKALQ